MTFLHPEWSSLKHPIWNPGERLFPRLDQLAPETPTQDSARPRVPQVRTWGKGRILADNKGPHVKQLGGGKDLGLAEWGPEACLPAISEGPSVDARVSIMWRMIFSKDGYHNNPHSSQKPFYNVRWSGIYVPPHNLNLLTCDCSRSNIV